MNYIQLIEKEQAGGEIQEIFEKIEQQFGMIPNIFKALANSATSLKSFNNMNEMLENGAFTNAQLKAALLAVSQVNQCNYCLAAHTNEAQSLGYSEQDTVDMRTGNINDSKLKAITQLAREITITHGHPENEYVNQFFEAGYTREQFTELFTVVAIKTLSNYFHNATNYPVDMPEAPKVEETSTIESRR
ncbi:MAG: hypothetical protein GVY19_03645 [Bacteroidetes bacterium]|nr:hypothetical protein [Bacteroidota bacterium]